MIVRIALALALLSATPVLAQEATAYGAPEVVALVSAKTQVARVIFMDGNGQQAGLIAFIRAPGEEPRVEVRLPPANEWRQAYPPMMATISAAAWRDVLEAGAGFDLVPASPQPAPPGQLESRAICMHAWRATVEMVDAQGNIRRRHEDACQDGAAVRYGFTLAKAAVAALPACATLDAARARNAVTQLRDCSMLSGDRAAAAEAFNAWSTPWFAHPRGPDFARPLAYLFSPAAKIVWPGDGAVKADASEAWVAKGNDRRFQPRRIIGETADRVRMEGIASVRANENAEYVWAPATLVWIREGSRDFRVLSFKPD